MWITVHLKHAWDYLINFKAISQIKTNGNVFLKKHCRLFNLKTKTYLPMNLKTYQLIYVAKIKHIDENKLDLYQKKQSYNNPALTRLSVSGVICRKEAI